MTTTREKTDPSFATNDSEEILDLCAYAQQHGLTDGLRELIRKHLAARSEKPAKSGWVSVLDSLPAFGDVLCARNEVVAAIRSALSGAATVEPVAWRCKTHPASKRWLLFDREPQGIAEDEVVEALYVTPPSAMEEPTRQIDKRVTIQASEHRELLGDAGRYRWLRDNMRCMPLGEKGQRHFFDQPGTMSFQEAVDEAANAAVDRKRAT